MKALVPRGNLSTKKVLDSERFFLTEIRMPLYCPHRVKAAQSKIKMLPPIKGDQMKYYIIRNTMKQAVGIYIPSQQGYYGTIELISDYAGVKHAEICRLVAPDDNNIGSVTCNTNANWLKRYIANPPVPVEFYPSPRIIPTAHDMKAEVNHG